LQNSQSAAVANPLVANEPARAGTVEDVHTYELAVHCNEEEETNRLQEAGQSQARLATPLLQNEDPQGYPDDPDGGGAATAPRPPTVYKKIIVFACSEIDEKGQKGKRYENHFN